MSNSNNESINLDNQGLDITAQIKASVNKNQAIAENMSRYNKLGGGRQIGGNPPEDNAQAVVPMIESQTDNQLANTREAMEAEAQAEENAKFDKAGASAWSQGGGRRKKSRRGKSKKSRRGKSKKSRRGKSKKSRR